MSGNISFEELVEAIAQAGSRSSSFCCDEVNHRGGGSGTSMIDCWRIGTRMNPEVWVWRVRWAPTRRDLHIYASIAACGVAGSLDEAAKDGRKRALQLARERKAA